ncbi:MAG: response regulator transcription factor [Anaerolineae bacterium]|jgi:DNA-binding NarL/FixJ family response regulator|nr:response regulator transcription factor [Anaerolineae bacterium]MBT7069472.1 response regulator transcription factor [Anaerolineae bacterium]MBT7325125.1 response regulator transcription factor [Anaerolineae bacterium]
MMPNLIRVLLVDDQRLMRDGLRTLIELETDLDVAGEAGDGLEAVTAYRNLGPDIVLMDVRMPNLNGVEATRRIKADWPEANILILTTFDDDEYIFEGLRAGASGYLLKDVSGKELAEAIRTVANGGTLIAPSVARKVVSEFARLKPAAPTSANSLPEPLSEREIEILKVLAQGRTNKEIADTLHLAEGTVKNYVTSILQKIGARDRTQAALRARELGIL